MSRGLGQLQRTICDYLAATQAPASYETLRWELFEQRQQTDGRARLRNGRLPATLNTSLKRALVGLAEADTGRVTLETRHLASMQEFVCHYPGKSLIASVRKLRLDLLPALAASVETNKQQPSHSAAGNEDYYRKNYSVEQWAAFQQRWANLEPELIGQLARLSGEDRNTLFLLIARAKSLFEAAPLACDRSIAEGVRPLTERAALPPALAKKLAAFSASLLPPEQSGFLRVKSCIRTFAEIPRTGSHYELRPETLNQLEDACPQVVSKLPGYQRRDRSKKRSPVWIMMRPVLCSTYGPEIHALLDKTVFAKFVFIRPA
jgi:hypothetical protein